jgi:hypothetical protein
LACPGAMRRGTINCTPPTLMSLVIWQSPLAARNHDCVNPPPLHDVNGEL